MKNWNSLLLASFLILLITACTKEERPGEVKELKITKITITDIELTKHSPTNPNGECWDTNCGDPDVYLKINDQNGEQARITEAVKDLAQGANVTFVADLIVERTMIYHFLVFDEDPENANDEILIQEGYKFDSIVDDQPAFVKLESNGNEIEINLEYELE